MTALAVAHGSARFRQVMMRERVTGVSRPVSSNVRTTLSNVTVVKRNRPYVEECRLLGYKTPVRTSQETHYVSATESSLLMLCMI
jgi:hypothetical protein